MLIKKRILNIFTLLFFIFLNFISLVIPAKAATLAPSFTLTNLSAGQTADFYAEYTTVTDIQIGGKVTVAFRSSTAWLDGSGHVGGAVNYTDIDVTLNNQQIVLTTENVSIYDSMNFAVLAITSASFIPSGTVVKFYIGHNATGGSENSRVTVGSNLNIVAETLTSGGMSLDIGSSSATLDTSSVPEFSTFIYITTILGGLYMIHKKMNLNYQLNSKISI